MLHSFICKRRPHLNVQLCDKLFLHIIHFFITCQESFCHTNSTISAGVLLFFHFLLSSYAACRYYWSIKLLRIIIRRLLLQSKEVPWLLLYDHLRDCTRSFFFWWSLRSCRGQRLNYSHKMTLSQVSYTRISTRLWCTSRIKILVVTFRQSLCISTSRRRTDAQTEKD